MKKKSFFPTILFCLLVASIHAQSISVPFSSDAWDFGTSETKLEHYMGKESILLANGSIFLSDVQFLNGTIEVDLNFPVQLNFPGIIFRAQDETNYEHFYVRPHQSGNPDACQYTPNFNGYAGWQLYYGEGFGAVKTWTPGEWHHIKIEIKGTKAWVFIDDMDKPLLAVKTLKGHFPAGKLGLNSGPGVHFANFAYAIDETTYPAEATTTPSDPKLITSWQLSNVLHNKRFADKPRLDKDSKAGLNWTTYSTEPSGLMNIARYSVPDKDQTTVIAKLNIQSNQDEIKGLVFGYSDQVRVYVNGILQYQGANIFRSRDYRYLGTIGYFDAVYLNLKKGDNEVWFVVTENFGGWGIQAKFL